MKLNNQKVLSIVPQIHIRYMIIRNGNTKFEPYSIIDIYMNYAKLRGAVAISMTWTIVSLFSQLGLHGLSIVVKLMQVCGVQVSPGAGPRPCRTKGTTPGICHSYCVRESPHYAFLDGSGAGASSLREGTLQTFWVGTFPGHQ